MTPNVRSVSGQSCILTSKENLSSTVRIPNAAFRVADVVHIERSLDIGATKLQSCLLPSPRTWCIPCFTRVSRLLSYAGASKLCIIYLLYMANLYQSKCKAKFTPGEACNKITCTGCHNKQWCYTFRLYRL